MKLKHKDIVSNFSLAAYNMYLKFSPIYYGNMGNGIGAFRLGQTGVKVGGMINDRYNMGRDIKELFMEELNLH